jgi:hypothetical protein
LVFQSVLAVVRAEVEFCFEFELGQPEQDRACRVIYHRRWSTRAVYGFFVLLIVGALRLHTGDVAVGNQGWALGVGAVAAIAAVGTVGSYTSPYWMVRNLRKRNRAAEGAQRYRLYTVGIEASSPAATTSIEWACVTEVYETGRFLLFYLAKGLAVVLPKRVVPSHELRNLRSAIRDRVSERAHLLADHGVSLG